MREPRFENPEITLKDLSLMQFLKERYGASVHEHEIFMVFNNDCDAINFDEWWHAEGRDLFVKKLREAAK